MRVLVPRTIEETSAFLRASAGDVRVLAGGTDLVVQMRSGRRQPDTLVDIKRVPELARVERDTAGAWHIGSAVCAAEIWEHRELREEWPGFAEAAHLIGSMQVQSRATPVGNLCNGSPAADSVPAAIAAGATVTVVAATGQRTVSVESLLLGPGRTRLAPGEFICAIHLPARRPWSADAYLRLTPRAEMDIAVVGAGVNLTLDDSGRCRAARVCLGAVAATPLLVSAAGAALIGTRVDPAALEALGEAVAAACTPIDDRRGTADYRRRMAPVIARRAASVALQRVHLKRIK